MNSAVHTKIQYWGWNKAAPYYDDLWQNQLRNVQKLLLSEASVNPGDKVLDICCGSGLVTIPAAQAAEQGETCGTDFSEEMLEIARSVAQNHNLNNVRFEIMNAENLTFPDGYYHVVINALGIMYLADPVKAIREMYRVLKPGGRATVLVWGSRRNCGWADVFPIIDKRVASEVCPLFFQMGTGQTLLYSFQSAGFVDTEEQRISDILHFDNDQDAADAMFIGGPVALAWNRFNPDIRQLVYAEYLDSLKPWKKGDEYDIPAEFVLVKGIKR